MTLRVAHIYRRFGDTPRRVHRHADFSLPDQHRDLREGSSPASPPD
jgi:hypothetical protein